MVRARLDPWALGWVLAAGACLQAQALMPPVGLALLGEWHVGVATVPAGLRSVITEGGPVTFGIAFPSAVGPGWLLRPRYDDGRFSGVQAFQEGPAYATARTSVKIRLLSLDILREAAGDGRSRVRPYLGVGAGVAQTWHRRENLGVLTIPGLPPGAESESWSPAGRLFAGIRLSRGFALEAQVQASSHSFEGHRYHDASAALSLRFWPLELARGREGPN